MEQLAFNFEQLEEAILDPLAGEELDEISTCIASLLLEASSKKPLKGDVIIRKVQELLDVHISLRQFHILMRRMRKDIGLPILSRRSAPAGYWWCSSIDEMAEFKNDFLSQAHDELHTLSRMLKRNYPKLAGQLRLDLQP